MAIEDANAHRVYVRQLWSSDWTLVENLFCESYTQACSPSMPEAVLYWNYGDIMPYGGATFAQRGPVDYLDFFVKIELDQIDGRTLYWYGTIKEEIDRRRGGFGGGVLSGQQFLRCYGMEYFLARTQITSSWVLNHITLADQEVKRAIGFNLGDGNGGSGLFEPNRSTVGGALGDNIFADMPEDANDWVAATILDYLLVYLGPKDNFGIAQIPFRMDPAYSDQLASLDWWKPQLYVEGRTLKEVFDAILSRQRLMSYRLAVENNEVLVQAFAFAEADIILPTFTKIRANNAQVTMNVDNDALVQSADIVKDTQPTYDVVYSRGERATSTFTLITNRGETTTEALEPDWATSLQTEYNGGADSADAVSDWYKKSQRHKNFRKQHRYERVYRYFRVPTDWDGLATDGEVVVYKPDNVEEVDTFWRIGMRFENRTPLRIDVDYETVSENPTDLTLNGDAPEYLRPFVMWVGDSQVHRPYFLDRPASTQEYAENPATPEREWGLTCRPQRNNFGFILDVSGAPQHVIASEEFEAADATDENDFEAEIKWQDIAITATIRLDSFCSGQWPDPLPPIPGSVQRAITLDIPGKRLDYIVPNTIVDIDDGQLKRSDGGFVRDDRDDCRDLARLTYDWYATERRSIDLMRSTTDTTYEVGQLVTTFGFGGTLTTVNSVITSMTFDLRQNTLAIRTQYGEMDFRGL